MLFLLFAFFLPPVVQKIQGNERTAARYYPDRRQVDKSHSELPDTQKEQILYPFKTNLQMFILPTMKNTSVAQSALPLAQ